MEQPKSTSVIYFCTLAKEYMTIRGITGEMDSKKISNEWRWNQGNQQCCAPKPYYCSLYVEGDAKFFEQKVAKTI